MGSNPSTQDDFLSAVRSSVAAHGFHITAVIGEQEPRFVYTIGVSQTRRVELLLAGAYAFSVQDVGFILTKLAQGPDQLRHGAVIRVDPAGDFLLRSVDPSWGDTLARGVKVFFDGGSIPMLQVVPDQEHTSADVPDLSFPRSAGRPMGPWSWIDEIWPFSVPANSTVITNMPLLRGSPATEAIRWEEGRWQVFAGPSDEVLEEAIRLVPLAVIIGLDPSLEPILELGVEEGILRDPPSDWHPWD